MGTGQARRRGPAGGRHGVAAGAATGVRPVPVRAVGLILAAVAALYVVLPAVHQVSVPLVHADFGLDDTDEALAQVVGVAVAMVALVAAGRTGDRLGRRPVLQWSLAALAAGCLTAASAFDGWSYLLGRIVVSGASAAVYITCLAFLAAVSSPGRLRKVIGGWLIAISLGYAATLVLAPRLTAVVDWRVAMAVLAAAAAGAVPLVARCLPAGGGAARRPEPRSAGLPMACWLTAGVLVASGLQLAPWWGWADPWIVAMLAAGAGALLLGVRCGRAAARRRGPSGPWSGRAWPGVLGVGVVAGFGEAALAVALPSLLAGTDVGADDAALVLAAFGVGGAVGAWLVRRFDLAPLAGCSLGLPLAAVGLALFHALLGRTHVLASGIAVVAVVGCGFMLALSPQIARYVTAFPRGDLGGGLALLPGAVALGAAAAQAVPGASAVAGTPAPAPARQVLFVAALLAAAVALLLGRPVVALVVAAVSVLQYVAAKTQSAHPVAVVIGLAVGTLAGTVVWRRQEQSDRLARTEATASALQHAVLHELPSRLGGLELAGSYRPATSGTGIGGDFLEALATPYGTRIVIGDVRGKGLQAVRTVTDLLGCFRSQAHETPQLGELAARMDRQVVRAAAERGDGELFATALLLQYDAAERTLAVISCGHAPPLAVSPSGVREIAVPPRLPLGFGSSDVCTPSPVVLAPDETVVAYTDGLDEARNATGEFFPLPDRIAAAPHGGPSALVTHLDREVRAWTHQLTDDIALVALRVDGPAVAKRRTGERPDGAQPR